MKGLTSGTLLALFLLILVSVHLLDCSEVKEKVDEIKNNIKNYIKMPMPSSSLFPSQSSQISQSDGPVILNSSLSFNSASKTLVKTGLFTNSSVIVSPEFCKDEVRWHYIVENVIFCAINQNELSAYLTLL